MSENTEEREPGPYDTFLTERLARMQAEHPEWLRPALRDVPERDDQIRLVVLQVGERGAERDGVSVHVGEEGDPHIATPYAERATATSGSGT